MASLSISNIPKYLAQIILGASILLAMKAIPSEDFYRTWIDNIVQQKCVNCHRSGGVAQNSGLLFSESISSNHLALETYVNTPSLGSKGDRLLAKIRGAAGHGGGVQVAQGTPEYEKFQEYIELLSEKQPITFTVTPRADEEGAIQPSTVQTVEEGTQISFEIVPNVGFDVANVSGTCGGDLIGTSYETDPIISDCTVRARFSAATPASTFRVALEEPVQDETHTGVGNLRGWAVSTEGIVKIEVLIDGGYAFEAPYGGDRPDVAGAFPDVTESEKSGFSLAYNYSELSAGQHTISVVAHNNLGETRQSSADFTVVKFAKNFISDPNAADLNNSGCFLENDEISVIDAIVDGDLYDLTLKWRTAEQGFEITEIR